MAPSGKLELVIEVDTAKGNASIKGFNNNLSSIEQAAAKAGRGAAQGIDGMTASMVKGAAAGVMLGEVMLKALSWAKAWTVAAIQGAMETERLQHVTLGLARAHTGTTAKARRPSPRCGRLGTPNATPSRSPRK